MITDVNPNDVNTFKLPANRLGGFFFRGTEFYVVPGETLTQYPAVLIGLPDQQTFTAVAHTVHGDSPFTGPVPSSYWTALEEAIGSWFEDYYTVTGNRADRAFITAIYYQKGSEIGILYPPVEPTR